MAMSRTIGFLKPVPAERSWWVGADRVTFTEQAWAEADRMGRGRCASCVNPLERWWQDKRRKSGESLFVREQQIVSHAERV